MQTRPPTVTVPAILFFIMESFALFGVLSNLVTMSLIPSDGNAAANPVFAAMNQPQFAAFQKIMTPVGLLLALMGLTVGFGLLKGSELARKTGVGLGLAKAVTAILTAWMTITYLNPALQKTLATIQPHGQADQAMQATMTVAMSAGAVGGALFGVAVAGVFIVLLTRRSAKVFCTGQFIKATPPPLP